MTSLLRNTVLLSAILIMLVGATLYPYGGDPSALFHMDVERAVSYSVPEGFIILGVPGYDGMQYYDIAKNFALVFQPSQWPELNISDAMSYSYQRALLPALAFAFSFNQVTALPWVFLIINLTCLVLTGLLVFRRSKNPLFGFALALCPAAMVGLHFSLAEPVTLLLCTLLFLLLEKTQRMGAVEVLLLSALVLAREVNVLLAAFLVAFFLWKYQWRNALLACIGIVVFVAWHTVIYKIFAAIPFLWSTDKHGFPGWAVLEIFLGWKGWNALTLSSIALCLGFVLPATIMSVQETIKTRLKELLPLGALAFLLLMWAMPDHIWGSVTSIGRVITPVYPFVILLCVKRNDVFARVLTGAILVLGVVTAAGLISVVHPFTLS